MLHKWGLPTRWLDFFAGRSGSTASQDTWRVNSRREAPPVSLPAWAGTDTRRSDRHASRPRRPAPVPGTEGFWLALVSSYLPESVWSTLEDGLRLAVRTRAYWGQTGQFWPDERPEEPPEWRRFGIHGEELVPQARLEVTGRLVPELKRVVHTLEAPELSRLERQRRLLLHGARLGQLYQDLGRRAPHQPPLEELCRALAALLA